jgi:hypothetical protein
MFGHMRMMGIVKPPFLCCFKCFDRIAAPEENDVGDQGPNLEIFRIR